MSKLLLDIYDNHKKYGDNNKFLVRRETSILTTNKDIIEKLKDSIKDFVL